MSLPTILKASSSPALIEGDVQVSYDDLIKLVDETARLVSSVASHGDFVSMAFPNTIEFVITFLGVVRAGCVAAPLNSGYTSDEFNFYLEDAGAKIVLLPGSGNVACEEASKKLGLKVFKTLWQNGSLSIPGVNPTTLPAMPAADDTALFLHTSGTTSRPKGVPLTNGNMVASLGNILKTYEFTDKDKTLIVMPLFHVHGLMCGLLATLATHGTCILPLGGKFSAGTFWQDMDKHQCTWYTAVPTIHQILLSRFKGGQDDVELVNRATKRLRFIRSCSSALVPAVFDDLEASFKAPVLEAYAMSEASHQMCSNPLPKYGQRKSGTVGKPTGIKLGILDDNNKLLPQGEVGQVAIQGPNVMKGYRNNPDANKANFVDGWFLTGDRGKLDQDGYLTLTGRIKELINRGGEKISPLEIDAILLQHPEISEAVAFGMPDSHYGETVAAAVVLHKNSQLTPEDVQAFLKDKLAPFKIPKKVFIATDMPRTATGKIQRRFVAEHFLQSKPAVEDKGKGDVSGFDLVAQTLHRLGLHYAYGVVGIPVTYLATAIQNTGTRFIGMHNEQAASMAAGAAGYLTALPGLCLTVSGPGVINALAGLANAQVNKFPMILLSGASDKVKARGEFQDLDQIKATAPYVKLGLRANSISEIVSVIAKVAHATIEGVPGAGYVDLPSAVLRQRLSNVEANQLLCQLKPLEPIWKKTQSIDAGKLDQAVKMLSSSQNPLIVVGKGASFARAEDALEKFVEKSGIPFLSQPMAKGILPDRHSHSANAARSLVMAKADVVLVIGARLNWMLAFGDAPKWNANAKFILVDVDADEIHSQPQAFGIVADARQFLFKATEVWSDTDKFKDWRMEITKKSGPAIEKLEQRLQVPVKGMMDYHASLGVIKQALTLYPETIIVSEGANTMDMARMILDMNKPRKRLDAGTWGTMGIGLGYSIAASTVSKDLVVAIEGDSAFGFSGIEVEVLARYQLPVVVFVFNNGGVYGGDRRTEEEKQSDLARNDPPPTSFVQVRYDQFMESLGGKGYRVDNVEDLKRVCQEAFSAKKPAVVDVVIDPFAGSESGRLHSMN